MPSKCKCGKVATYGFKRPAKFCNLCKTDDMVRLSKISTCKCGSGKQSYYGLEGTKPNCCKDCKTNDMIILSHRRCKCGKIANFGLEGTKPNCCKDCKSNDMIDLKNKKCKCGNNKLIIYGLKGNKPTNCMNCKTEDMINLTHKRCKCGKIANFGFKNGNKIACGICKSNDMINLSSKKIVCKCGKIVYNKMCNDCFKKRIDNQKSKLCSCGKYSRYGYINEKATHCNNCKKENMINLISQKCQICKIKYPSYGYKIRTHCKSCKENNMIYLNCLYCKCGNIAKYNYRNLKPNYCSICKEDDMINVCNTCKSGYCNQIGNIKYDYYCTHCFANLFPSDPKTLTIYKKSKEIKVVSYISQIFKGFVHDKPLYFDLKGGCCDSKRRIDLRKLIGNTLLCIEIDENQHKYYNKEDELNRYDNLFIDFSGKYIFIRYNPDKYKINGKIKNPKFKTRMKVLEDEIYKQIGRINIENNIELIEIIKLYYNQS